MWNLGSYGSIYAWQDGFLYPLGWQNGWHIISFTYGNVQGTGLLDFQYISWTHQRDKIGPPKFYALAIAFSETTERAAGNVEYTMAYSGSKWGGEIGTSTRFFETRLRVDCNFTSGGIWGRGKFEIGLGVGWAKPDIPLALNDMGVTINFTSINYTGNPPLGTATAWWEMHLEDYRIDIYSFSGLDLCGMEFTGEGNIQSIVNPDWTAAIDYTGTIIMFVSTTMLPETPAIIGSLVGVGIKGIATVVRFNEGQSLPQYIETVSQYHFRRVEGTSAIVTSISGSKSSAVFFKLNPNEHFRCGLTKIVLSGTLVADACFWNPPGLIAHNPFPMANIVIYIEIPWFIW